MPTYDTKTVETLWKCALLQLGAVFVQTRSVLFFLGFFYITFDPKRNILVCLFNVSQIV